MTAINHTASSYTAAELPITKCSQSTFALAAAAVIDATTASLAGLAADEAGAEVNCTSSVICGTRMEGIDHARTDKTATTHAQEGPLRLLLACLRQRC
jgi:hypothetical protein